MGFSLFGTSGDKTTTNQTTNQTYDWTKSNSDNVEGSFNSSDSRVYNTALTRNQSNINNDTKIQNTALQLTDSFNRFTTNNLANVGNTNIGKSGTSADDTAALLLAMQGLQPPRGLNDAVPDLTTGLLDFNTLSQIATANIKASSGQAKSVFDGFASNVSATTGGVASMNSGGTSDLVKYGLLAVVAIVIAFFAFKR